MKSQKPQINERKDWLFGKFKPCNLACELQHEGFCTEPDACDVCKAKINDDLESDD